MFEHFTFGAQAQTPYAQHEDSFPSPTDCSFRLETPPPTSCSDGEVSRSGINDIVGKFSEQSIRPGEDERPQRSIWNNPLPAPEFDIDTEEEFAPEELSYISTGRGKVTLASHSQSLPNLPVVPRNGTVACRRLQRQLNVQLQSCNSHIRNISALVEDMISTSSQCRLHKSTSRPYINSPLATPFITEPLELDVDNEEPGAPALHEDEGFVEMDDSAEDEFSLRRAGTPSGIRKFGYNIVRYKSSGDCVRGPMVLSRPRMRRRKPVAIAE